MIDRTDIARQAEELRSGGATDEDILRYLRKAGLTILECIQVLRATTGMSLSDAKHIVHFSDTWSDHRSDHDRFQELLGDVVETIERKRKP